MLVNNGIPPLVICTESAVFSALNLMHGLCQGPFIGQNKSFAALCHTGTSTLHRPWLGFLPGHRESAPDLPRERRGSRQPSVETLHSGQEKVDAPEVPSRLPDLTCPNSEEYGMLANRCSPPSQVAGSTRLDSRLPLDRVTVLQGVSW
jgi:hypothetical protein